MVAAVPSSPSGCIAGIATEECVVQEVSGQEITDTPPPDNLHALSIDQQSLAAFAAGDLDALGLLIERYRGLLTYQCRKLTGGHADDAKDLFSMVLLKVYTESPQQLMKIQHFGGWLTRLAQNKYIDLQRMRMADRRRDESLGQLHELGASHPWSPEQILLKDELLGQIEQAFNALPQRLRTVAELRFVQEASYELISNQLGITQVNARKRVQEARGHLGRALQAYCRIDERGQLPGHRSHSWADSDADASGSM